MTLIATSNTVFFARKLQRSGVRVILLGKKERTRKFPDGEMYVRLSFFKDRKVLVLHSGSPNPNDGLVELEMILSILKNDGKEVSVFFTYFPYGMQDKDRSGEANAAQEIIKKLIKYYHVREIFVVDPHFSGKKWVNKYPVKILSAFSLLKAEATKKFKDLVFISADEGSKKRTGLPGFTKKRLSINNVKLLAPFSIKRKLKGKNVAIVDDLIE